MANMFGTIAAGFIAGMGDKKAQENKQQAELDKIAFENLQKSDMDIKLQREIAARQKDVMGYENSLKSKSDTKDWNDYIARLDKTGMKDKNPDQYNQLLLAGPKGASSVISSQNAFQGRLENPNKPVVDKTDGTTKYVSAQELIDNPDRYAPLSAPGNGKPLNLPQKEKDEIRALRSTYSNYQLVELALKKEPTPEEIDILKKNGLTKAQPTNTGYLLGKAPDGTSQFLDAGGVGFRTLIGNMGMEERHNLFGATLTGGEQKSWNENRLNVGDQLPTIKAKLAVLAPLAEKSIEARKQDLIVDRGATQDQVDKLFTYPMSISSPTKAAAPTKETATNLGTSLNSPNEQKAAPTAPVQITGDEDYNKLESGTTYIDPEGNVRTKQ